MILGTKWDTTVSYMIRVIIESNSSYEFGQYIYSISKVYIYLLLLTFSLVDLGSIYIVGEVKMIKKMTVNSILGCASVWVYAIPQSVGYMT